MSPVLSRPNYFLTVLNRLKEHSAAEGSLEQQLQTLLLRLAQSVQTQKALSPDLVEGINEAFRHYPAVRLKLKAEAHQENDLLDQEGELSFGAGNHKRALLLQAEFADAPDQLRRIYMEAIVSLLEAMERETLELQTCMQCGGWFIPYQRAQVTKFCGAKCRNRYHYLLTRHPVPDRQEAAR